MAAGKSEEEMNILGPKGIILGGALGLIAFFVFLEVMNDRDGAPAKKLPPAVEAAMPKPALQVEEFKIGYGRFGMAVIGMVENRSDKKYGFVQLSINLYDSSGARVGSTVASISDLAGYGKWKFEAPITQGTATRAEIGELTGF